MTNQEAGAALPIVDEWHEPATAPEGVEVLVWRLDICEPDKMVRHPWVYGYRAVAHCSSEFGEREWFSGDGNPITEPRLWTHLPAKPKER